jgi:hypothetical protein
VGEKTISAILVANTIEHRYQYTISDCVDKSVLPFDIAILDNGKLLGLIEYQGIQHFDPIPFYGGEEALETNKRRDEIKFNYCKDHNIPLLIISYKENIKDKLKEFTQSIGIEIDVNLKLQPALNRNFLSYEDAKSAILVYNFQNVVEYKNCKDLPLGVPKNPEKVYRADQSWINWGDYLGTGTIQSKKAEFLSFEDCKKWFLENGISSERDWRKKRKDKPKFIPCNPEKIYRMQWEGWKKFLNKL